MSTIKKIIVLFCSLFFFQYIIGGQAFAQLTQEECEPYEPQVVEKKTVIALFGDSLTISGADPTLRRFGCGDEHVGITAQRLESLLSSRSSIVSNLGIGGTFSSFGVSRARADLFSVTTRFADAEAYHALILYGTNDLSSSVPSRDVGFNIREIARHAINRGFNPAVGTIPVRNGFDPSSYNASIISALSGLDVDVPVVDINAVITLDDLQADGFHPNEAGYEMIARKWFDDYLKSVIPFNGAAMGALNLLLEEDPPVPPPLEE